MITAIKFGLADCRSNPSAHCRLRLQAPKKMSNGIVHCNYQIASHITSTQSQFAQVRVKEQHALPVARPAKAVPSVPLLDLKLMVLIAARFCRHSLLLLATFSDEKLETDAIYFSGSLGCWVQCGTLCTVYLSRTCCSSLSAAYNRRAVIGVRWRHTMYIKDHTYHCSLLDTNCKSATKKGVSTESRDEV